MKLGLSLRTDEQMREDARAVIRVQLTKKGARALRRRINGDGGFQRLLVQLRVATSPDGVLTLTPDVAEKVGRYLDSYGQGGFQSRLGYIAGRRLFLATAHVPRKPGPARQAGPGEAIDRPAGGQRGVRGPRALEASKRSRSKKRTL